MAGRPLLIAASEDFDHIGVIIVMLEDGRSCLGCGSGCNLMD